jgi:hypothetical protein
MRYKERMNGIVQLSFGGSGPNRLDFFDFSSSHSARAGEHIFLAENHHNERKAK